MNLLVEVLIVLRPLLLTPVACPRDQNLLRFSVLVVLDLVDCVNLKLNICFRVHRPNNHSGDLCSFGDNAVTGVNLDSRSAMDVLDPPRRHTLRESISSISPMNRRPQSSLIINDTSDEGTANSRNLKHG